MVLILSSILTYISNRIRFLSVAGKRSMDIMALHHPPFTTIKLLLLFFSFFKIVKSYFLITTIVIIVSLFLSSTKSRCCLLLSYAKKMIKLFKDGFPKKNIKIIYLYRLFNRFQ